MSGVFPSALVFGALTMRVNTLPRPQDGSAAFTVKANDTDFGTPEPITSTLLSLLQYGSPVGLEQIDNRSPVLRVTITAKNLNALAAGEKRLLAECGKRNTLTVVPSDGVSKSTVFDVVWSQADLVFDQADMRNVQLTYLVRIQALPHTRGEDPVSTPATPATPTYTLVDNGSALSGGGFSWTLFNSPGSTLSVVSGRIRSTAASGATYSPKLVRNGAVTLGSNRYLVLDIAASNYVITSVKITFPAFLGPVANLATRIDLGGGLTRMFFALPPSVTSIDPFQISFVGTAPAPASSRYVEIDQVQLSDAIPFFGTSRQKVLALNPGGSVPTEGSIAVSHASSALGFTLVHTSPAGLGGQPPMRPWLVSSSATTVNAANISGFFNKIRTASIFRFPVTAVPEGLTEIWANLAPDSATGAGHVITTTVQGYMGSTAVGPAQVKTMSTAYPSVIYYFLSLGSFTMPPSKLGPSGFVQVTIQQTAGAIDLNLDEGWLLPKGPDCGLTIVECGTAAPGAGGSSNLLWIDAPSLDQPYGALWVGNAADRSDARYPGADFVRAWGRHAFSPDGTAVFVATQNALDASTALTHYRRYGNFVLDES